MGSARCCKKPRFFVPFSRAIGFRADGSVIWHVHVIEHDLKDWPLRRPLPHARAHRLFDDQRGPVVRGSAAGTYEGPLAA
jgi:hypothetical protein